MGAAEDRQIEAIAAELRARRAACAPLPEAPGVYAYFLRPGASLGCVQTDADGLLYVGMTKATLAQRDHLAHGHSGFSTLRRSLGALLKGELRVEAWPRVPGPSARNRRNYRFPDDGERRLTDWMRENLLRASREIGPGEVTRVEKGLIRLLRPPLNLKGCNNPQAAMIRERRDRCVAEASSRPGGTP